MQELIEKAERKKMLFPFASTYRVSETEYEAISAMSEKERSQRVDIIREEGERLCQGKKIDNLDRFVNTMLILGHLQEATAFLPLLSLADICSTVREVALGEYFLFEDWPRLLVSTAHGRWELIEKAINEAESEDVVCALLSAAEGMVFDGQVSRERVVEFIQHHFQNILRCKVEVIGELGAWVATASTLWPGECLEEIRELYGLRLVDVQRIGIDGVLEDYSKGLDGCFLSNCYTYAPFVVVHDNNQKCDEEVGLHKATQSMKDLIKKLSAIEDTELMLPAKESHLISTPSVGRNDLCSCGSGKKFKRCCFHAKQEEERAIRLESYNVTWEASEMDHRKAEDQALIESLSEKLKTEPEACIEPLIGQIKKCPEDPALYNYLYLCYVVSEKIWEAQELLLKTIQLFPDYLFGLVEYASYLLRRGDYDKVPEVFKGCKTLRQLYPDTDVFHISEVKAFQCIMGRYFLAVGNIDQAKIYLSILEKLDDECDQVECLRHEITMRLRQQSLNKLLVC